MRKVFYLFFLEEEPEGYITGSEFFILFFYYKREDIQLSKPGRRQHPVKVSQTHTLIFQLNIITCKLLVIMLQYNQF